MAQFTGIVIDIGGKSIKQFSSLSLSQSIFEHHAFRLVCPTEAIDGTSGAIFNVSKNLIGGSFTLQIDSIGSTGTLQFSGVVTQVEAARHSGHAGDIIISGYSPTILLDNGSHCKTWEKKAVRNIAQDVLKHFPQNLLQPKITPSYGETLSYTVQYKESAWQFLNRLSATYGEWFFYDGRKIVLGPPQGNKAKLIYGSNLPSFNMALQVRPASFQMMAYDYMNSEVYDGSPKSIAGKAGLSDLGKHALQKSEQFYGTQPKQWHNHFLTNKKQLDDFVNTRAAMQSSNMVRFNGSSGHPGVMVGGSVSVMGKNVFSLVDESFGDYTVISVNHYCDGHGNYSNDFVSIPSSVKYPPVTAYADPHCETQSAFVTDNHDPKGLGRIRVKFHWMNGSEKSPWLRVTTPHAGGGKGMFFIPEVGEEVIVGFEGDSSTKPYIIGAVYHGKAKNSYSNGGNDIKALQSRSGNKVILNDNDGSVHITDKGGADTMMDGSGNIVTNANVNSTLNAGSQAAINVGAKDGGPAQALITMDAAGNIVIDGKTSITIKVGNNIITISKDGINTTAAVGNIKTTADIGAVNVSAAAGEMTLHSKAAFKAGSSATLSITGAEVQINKG